MNLSTLIAEYGDENVKFQHLDSCFIEAKAKKGHNEVTFGTGAGFGANGMNEIGLIVWMDRDKVDEIMKKEQSKIKNHTSSSDKSFSDRLKELEELQAAHNR